MSRCFPYPPPGYSLNRGSKEALIESIKLQRDKERVKAEKKKEKKEKRREKKEKKEKKKEKKEKKEKKDEKVRESEIEHLERSNLTEEHEKAIGYQNPTSSSDSTHNSSKRKRPIESSEEEQAIRGGHGGKVVKIRLSSQKQKAVEAPIICFKEPCSTSDVPLTVPTKTHLVPGTVKGNVSPTLLRTNSQENISPTPFRTNSAVHGAVKANILPKQVGPNRVIPGAVKENISPTLLRTNCKDNIFPTQVARAVEVNSVGLLRPPRPDKASKEVVCSTSGRRESIIKEDKRNALETEKKLSRGELKYKNLIENWNPPPLVVEKEKGMELDDEDWLFSTSTTKKNVSEKKLKTSENALCSSSSAMLWPRAQLLPEVDIYALPYTIPF